MLGENQCYKDLRKHADSSVDIVYVTGKPVTGLRNVINVITYLINVVKSLWMLVI